MNGWWAFIGSPLPAGETNDIGKYLLLLLLYFFLTFNKFFKQLGLLELHKKSWETHLDVRDLLIADGIFRSLRDSLNLVSSRPKPRNEELKNWQKEENRQITITRGISPKCNNL